MGCKVTGENQSTHTPGPAQPWILPLSVLRQCCRPATAGLCPSFKVPVESAMPHRPCTRWPSAWALCPLPCRHHQPPRRQRRAGLPGSASSTLCSAHTVSSSLWPAQALSEGPAPGEPWTVLGRSPGAGWHTSWAIC